MQMYTLTCSPCRPRPETLQLYKCGHSRFMHSRCARACMLTHAGSPRGRKWHMVDACRLSHPPALGQSVVCPRYCAPLARAHTTIWFHLPRLNVGAREQSNRKYTSRAQMIKKQEVCRCCIARQVVAAQRVWAAWASHYERAHVSWPRTGYSVKIHLCYNSLARAG